MILGAFAAFGQCESVLDCGRDECNRVAAFEFRKPADKSNTLKAFVAKAAIALASPNSIAAVQKLALFRSSRQRAPASVRRSDFALAP
jgi:hypothetical protein